MLPYLHYTRRVNAYHYTDSAKGGVFLLVISYVSQR